MDLKVRLRRNRKAEWVRELIAENDLKASDLIFPIFIQEGVNKVTTINSMPDFHRVSIDIAVQYAKKAFDLGVKAVMLFPSVDKKLKTDKGEEAFNRDNLICRAMKVIKEEVPNLGVIVDVALDPYTKHGHDGILNSYGDVDNDETLEALARQALILAEAGCDAVSPSDMMDGRVAYIREVLDKHGFNNTNIISYAAKYASNFYGPFRDGINSKQDIPITKITYQMDCRNSDEALREVEQDILEGVDLVIIKPGMLYLDVIARIKASYNIPIIAYQVSGEYAMFKFAAHHHAINYMQCMIESLIAFKRAGCSAIITYAAIEVAEYLNSR
jgi:porphobilinogen synthase